MRINPAQQVHGRQEIESAIAVIENGHWAEGIQALEFRYALSEYLDVDYVELTNSGSSANLAAVMALTTDWIPKKRRLKRGDEIITTALCFPTTVSPIVYSGCVPVFVDVEPGTWNINSWQVKEMITEKTKAIMVAHNLGNPFDIDSIKDICKEYGLWLIVDNCDSLGSEWRGKKTGTLGDIGTSSFYPAHHISCGEGGAVYTDNLDIHKGLRSMINWGRHCSCRPGQDNACGKRFGWQLGGLPYGYDHKNTYSEFGFNLKMTDIQAAIGIEQLKRLSGFTRDRRANHKFLRLYFERFEQWFELPEVYDGAVPSWFGYVVKLKEEAPFTRDEMFMYLDECDIKGRAFFCGNITKQPVLFGNKRFEYKKHKNLKVSDDVMTTAFWIGVHPAIGQKERDYMVSVLDKFLSKYK